MESKRVIKHLRWFLKIFNCIYFSFLEQNEMRRITRGLWLEGGIVRFKGFLTPDLILFSSLSVLIAAFVSLLILSAKNKILFSHF